MQNDPINETPLKLKPHRGSDLSALFISAAIGYVVTLKAPLFAGLITSCLLLILLSRLRNCLHQPCAGGLELDSAAEVSWEQHHQW